MMRQSLARLCWALGLVAAPSIVVAQADTRATEGDVATAAPLGGPTVFDASAQAHAAGTTTATTAMAAPRFPHMPVRPGEHFAAPFLDREGGPRDAGTIVLSSEMTAVQLETPRSPFQLREEVYIKLPKGANGDLGQRFLTYRLGPDYEIYGQVVIPTGIVQVVRAAGPGEATTVRISQMFGNMEVGQGVIPIDNPEFPAANAMVAAVENGPRSRVLWVDDEVVMTSLQYFLVLPIKESDGYRIGDQVTLVRPPDKDYDTGLVLPEVKIGIAQVVRVTPRSATVIVIHQDQPAIAPGVVTRVSAKMP
ncbi:MAG TPA: hypothetical protein VNW46_10960 [Gemmatimonadaceae bacterium]|nr:hypothetical protein [Gemmatimonadaceae bacterium]